MAEVTQEFRISNGDWVCARCGARLDPIELVMRHDHDGDRFSQEFDEHRGELICAGCGAYMSEPASGEGVVMEHEPDCPEVSSISAPQG